MQQIFISMRGEVADRQSDEYRVYLQKIPNYQTLIILQYTVMYISVYIILCISRSRVLHLFEDLHFGKLSQEAAN
jgi:hypothetical protein